MDGNAVMVTVEDVAIIIHLQTTDATPQLFGSRRCLPSSALHHPVMACHLPQ